MIYSITKNKYIKVDVSIFTKIKMTICSKMDGNKNN